MMLRKTTCHAAIAITGIAIGLASKAEAQTPAKVMDFFVGSCWTGEFADGKSTDTHCLTRMYCGAFVRDNHVVTGKSTPYAGETIYVWDEKAGQLAYTYYDSDGGVSRGAMLADDTGLRSPAEVYRAADGSETKISSRWIITGTDSWRQVSEEVSGEEPRVLWKVDYRRTGAAVEDPARFDCNGE